MWEQNGQTTKMKTAKVKVGDLVTGDWGVGLLSRIYDQDTGLDATIDDAKTKLLAAVVIRGDGGGNCYCFIHDLLPLDAEENKT